MPSLSTFIGVALLAVAIWLAPLASLLACIGGGLLTVLMAKSIARDDDRCDTCSYAYPMPFHAGVYQCPACHRTKP